MLILLCSGVSSHFVLSVFRYFWLRWKEGRVQVGEGSLVGERLIMEHAKENRPEVIASIGISTGWAERGRWEISNVDGKLDDYCK